MSQMKIIFTGGGTGGHVYPAISVADELKGDGVKILFVGTRRGMESSAVRKSGYEIRFILSRAVRGRGLLSKLITLGAISIGFFQALFILISFRPNMVFGAGGYASAAVVLAASLLRRRIVLQEQNSIPGMTNRLLAPMAERIYLGYPRARGYFKKGSDIRITGNPLRSKITDGTEGNRTEFGLDSDIPVILVFGGSQGAHSLNATTIEYILVKENVQMIIQTGEKDYSWVKERLNEVRERVYISAFISKIYRAYRAADVAVSRAGALSVSELAAVGLPAVLVPYPYAADNHQFYNAEEVVEAGGAVMIEDRELNVQSLGQVLDNMLNSPGKLTRMSEAMLSVARRDASEVIADDIRSMCHIDKGGNGS
jgi:UDP-N-acetylglucosamine--N-acetylmuramyl-(pentapeptide) pyrophosphoryl-undecaprenol N-acetylglucosamine transferase